MSALLLILAGAKIRPAGPLAKLAFLALLWVYLIWAAWAWHESSTGGGRMYFP
jgi:hypothetical protein